MKFSKLVLALGFACATFGASAQVTGNITVSANVPGACTLTVNPMSFGQYDSASNKDFTSTVEFNCTTSSTSAIALGYSGYATGAQRRMLNGTSNYMNYTIYQPSATTPGAACAYTTPWGNGTTGTTLLTGAATTGTSRSYNVCGRIPSGQTGLPVGTYQDNVAVTATL